MPVKGTSFTVRTRAERRERRLPDKTNEHTQTHTYTITPTSSHCMGQSGSLKVRDWSLLFSSDCLSVANCLLWEPASTQMHHAYICVCVWVCFFLFWTLTSGSLWSPTNGERPPRFPSFSPVRRNTAGRLPYHYHIISITLLRHSLARCLRTCYQLIERFNPQSAPCLSPHSPLLPSVHARCVFHPSKADVIEVEHWIYRLNEITQTRHDQPGPLSCTFRELLLQNLIALHPIQNF